MNKYKKTITQFYARFKNQEKLIFDSSRQNSSYHFLENIDTFKHNCLVNHYDLIELEKELNKKLLIDMLVNKESIVRLYHNSKRFIEYSFKYKIVSSDYSQNYFKDGIVFYVRIYITGEVLIVLSYPCVYYYYKISFESFKSFSIYEFLFTNYKSFFIDDKIKRIMFEIEKNKEYFPEYIYGDTHIRQWKYIEYCVKGFLDNEMNMLLFKKNVNIYNNLYQGFNLKNKPPIERILWFVKNDVIY
jgi:hypothetical protein